MESAAKRPHVLPGGGVLAALATDALRSFVETHRVPVAETQAGKGALPWDHPLQQGAIGVRVADHLSIANAPLFVAYVVLLVAALAELSRARAAAAISVSEPA